MTKSHLLIAALAAIAAIPFGPDTASAGVYLSAAKIAEGEAFADDPMFDSQGWLRGVDDAGGSFVAGGAVLIDPYWLLTATHVTLLANTTTPWESLSFSMSNRIFDEPQNLHGVDEWFTFPGYDTDPGQGTDIALVHLIDPIFDVIPAVRYRGTDEVGMRVDTVGYGSPGVWPRERAFDGVQRAGENIVDCVGCLVAVNNNYLLADFGLGAFTPSLPLEWGGNLDSGGGWFSDVNGEMQLIGISAFIRGNHTITGASRVSLYNDWIDSHVTSIPEPSSLALLGMVGTITLLVSRLRKTSVDC